MSNQYQFTAAHDLNSRSNTSHADEPKFRLPYFNGKGDLKSFLAMFDIGARKFHWNNDKQVEQLLCCFKYDALAFVTKLTLQTKASISALTEALERRYGNHLLPEHYRENLNQIRKLGKETLCEYAVRVEDLVNKAYPTLNSPELLSTLTIEHLLKGYTDQTLAYEVKTKSPKTVDEAMTLITWHACCKNGSKGRNEVSQVAFEDEHENEECTESDVRKIGSHSNKYVTEEKLEQRLQVFSTEIKQDSDKLRNDIRKDNNKIKDEISKLAATLKNSSSQGNTGNKIGSGSNKFSSVTCFSCNQKGHTSRFCKERKSKPGPVGSYSENSKRDGGSSVFNSFNKPRNELNG